MSKVVFFDEFLLRRWVEDLRLNETTLELPLIDEQWYSEVMSCVEVTQIHPDFVADCHRSGASIFYKVNKNHYRIDGNKRSAVISVYLFYIVNDYHLRPRPAELREFAKNIALSQKKSVECMEKIREFFEKNTKKMQSKTPT